MRRHPRWRTYRNHPQPGDNTVTDTQAWILVAEVGVLALAALVGLIRR